jgi:hypothetical protein
MSSSLSSSNDCCPTDVPPAINNYKGIGTMVGAGKLPSYPSMTMYQSVVPPTATTAVIVMYDIFGHSVGA